ncbi:MAG: aldehyde dehydrogenase family protein, partial [Acetobacteraceae bacterium]|nr:aldehyde dehydrogenase family protein [Acetobacteraceae bacterium]
MVEKTLAEVEKKISVRRKYDNYIGGEWVPPVRGETFENISPIDGSVVCKIARSTAEDIELALDAAHRAKDGWANMAAADRARILTKIADRMEEKLEALAPVEAIDNGKPIRETKAADLPLAVDHFRYFAGCIRAQEGSLSEI